MIGVRRIIGAGPATVLLRGGPKVPAHEGPHAAAAAFGLLAAY